MQDPLSDILSLVKIHARVSGRLRAGGSWSLRFPQPAVSKFNAVTAGACWLLVGSNREPVRLEAGDCFLLVRPETYVLASDPGLRPEPAGPVFAKAMHGLAQVGSGGDVMLIGGQLDIDAAGARLFLDQFPPLLLIRGGTPVSDQLRWILARLAEELAGPLPGSRLLLEYAAQSIFILLVRTYFEQTEAPPPGIMRGLADRRIVRALNAIHANPARQWSVRDLAVEAGMSRSGFAARFAATLGVGPITYLAEWRLELAARLLRDEPAPVSVVASQIGYGSESALGAAFRRRFGVGPATYGRRERSGHDILV